MKKVVTWEENERGCWICTSHKGHHGRPQKRHNGKNELLSHIIWEDSFGKIPAGQCVLHKCDNPSCIFIGHLFLGTQAENNKDRDIKNRQAMGEKNGFSKLTKQKVIEIRKSTETLKEIANRFMISIRQAGRIRDNIQWKHVA